MKAEEKVKQVYRTAQIEYEPFRLTVVAFVDLKWIVLGERLGFNRPESQAWADAWRRIQAQKESDGR